MSEKKGSPALLYAVGLSLVFLAVLAAAMLTIQRRHAVADESKTRKALVEAGPAVKVVKVALTPAERTISLPAEVHAWQQATLYSKISGYLKEIRVDKGDRVKRGQVLGIIESPENVEQVAAAAADLAWKTQQYKRTVELSKVAVMSQQELEQAEGAVRIAEAALARARAVADYGLLRAPFDGSVTARYADPGALVPAATGSTQNAQPVVDIAELARVRIYLYLGQEDAKAVKVGDPATLVAVDQPGEPIAATVRRLSGSLDPRTRTMLTEIDLANDPVRVFPGEFLRASIKVKGPQFPAVPSQALLGVGEKQSVALVRDGRIHLVPVRVGNDDGTTAVVVSGLAGGETVALNVAGEVEEGQAVQAVE